MRFEHRRQALLESQPFRQRVFRHLTVAVLYLLASLALGTVGSHYTEGTDWLDGCPHLSPHPAQVSRL